MKNLIKSIAVVFVSFLMAFFLMSSRGEIDTIKGIKVTSVDFRPSGGGWNINCTEKPVTWEDVKFYKARAEIKEPVNKPIVLRFGIKSGSHYIGIIDINFAPNTTWSESTTYERIAPGSDENVRPPSGTPTQPYTGGFWLCCTKECNVKGNGEKIDDSQAKIYMEWLSLNMDGIVTGIQMTCNSVQGKRSPTHTIKCTK